MGDTLPDQNNPQESQTAQQPSEVGQTGNVQTTTGDSAQGTAAVQPPSAATPVVTTEDAPQKAEHAPGEPLGNDAPSLASLENQQCPNCTTGVLSVVRYDPNALYETGQVADKTLDPGRRSGGAYEVRCRSCDFSESRAFNPGESWRG